MDNDVLQFFDQHLGALEIYQTLWRRLEKTFNKITVKVQKTQISFYNTHLFACVSFAKLRKDRPFSYLVVTFGLPERLPSERIDAAVEAYPGRWTHHIQLTDPARVDEELMGWLRQAYQFSAGKRRGRQRMQENRQNE